MPEITLDHSGYPILLGSVPVPTKSGNPFHNPLTGEFSFAPAGVLVLGGGNLLKLLSAGTRKVLADRAKIGKANQLIAGFIDGKIHIVLLRDGVRVHSFAVAPSQEKGKAQKEGESNTTSGKLQVTPVIKDALLEAARNLNLSDAELIKFIEEQTGVEIGEEQKQQILDLVQEQRLEDLIAYLHQQLRVRVDGAAFDDGLVTIAVGRGFFRKTFSGLDEAQTKIVLQRLEGKGWSENVLQAAIVSKFPKRLKKIFEIENKQQKGQEKIDESKSSRTRKAA
jgi:hypothetical protein